MNPTSADIPDDLAPAPGSGGEEDPLALTAAWDRDHVFHVWAAQAEIDPLVIARAEGSYLWDAQGRRYLDFSSQLVFTNMGHQHPRIVDAIQQQAARLCTISPEYAHETRARAARLIAERTPGDLDRVFFTNGGADANEHAIRMARLHTGRHKVLSHYRSYHGATHLAVHVTGDPRRWPSDHGSAGTVHFFGPYLYRTVFSSTTQEEESERALAHLEQVIVLEGAATIAAIMVESIPGTAGVLVPPPGYLAGVRDLCDRYGIVLIADEVMAGFGRAGMWFGIEHAGVVPDLITFAKGVNSGYVPLGGVAISAAIYESFAHRPYPGGLTYSGHPLACAAAVATIVAMEEEKILDHAHDLGRRVFGPGLRALAEKHAWIGEVRGLAAFWALDLVKDRRTREPLAPYGGTSPEMESLLSACRERGLIPFSRYNRIHVVPPVNITEEQALTGLDLLDDALTQASRSSPSP